MADCARDWEDYTRRIVLALNNLVVTTVDGGALSPDAALARWEGMVADLRKKNGEIFFCGNGASASMACHCAADMAKNSRVRTRVLTDPALISAVGNDMAYDEVFSAPLSWFMAAGDMLVVISSSGNSPNVLKAVATAREKGSICVTLSAFSPQNPLRTLGDLNFYIPTPTYGIAESVHATLLHHWMDICNATAVME